MKKIAYAVLVISSVVAATCFATAGDTSSTARAQLYEEAALQGVAPDNIKPPDAVMAAASGKGTQLVPSASVVSEKDMAHLRLLSQAIYRRARNAGVAIYEGRGRMYFFDSQYTCILGCRTGHNLPKSSTYPFGAMTSVHVERSFTLRDRAGANGSRELDAIYLDDVGIDPDDGTMIKPDGGLNGKLRNALSFWRKIQPSDIVITQESTIMDIAQSEGRLTIDPYSDPDKGTPNGYPK